MAISDKSASRTEPLSGVRCRRCGFVAAPAQDLGCERCGAHGGDLVPEPLTGRGTVLAAVTLYEHPTRDLARPLPIGSVQLAEGPVVRAQLTEDIRPGADVTAVVDGTGNRPALTFAPAKEA